MGAVPCLNCWHPIRGLTPGCRYVYKRVGQVTMARRLLPMVLILRALGVTAYGQTTFASITGVVMDSTGAAVPGATITATHTETNTRFTTRSNEVGNYNLAQLREGTYTLRAQAPGFKEFVAQNIVLVARDIRRVDITLEVGSVETTVEVTAGATLIETETARIADTKTATVLKTLPLNTRGIWAFLALSPNVLQAGGGSSTIRFAGSRTNQSHWSIDGTTMSDGVSETQIGPLANYIESFQEIKIDIANNTAEFGTIGQVTMISKSGTNSFHGSAFDYYIIRRPGSGHETRLRSPARLASAMCPARAQAAPCFCPAFTTGATVPFSSLRSKRRVAAPSRIFLTRPYPCPHGVRVTFRACRASLFTTLPRESHSRVTASPPRVLTRSL